MEESANERMKESVNERMSELANWRSGAWGRWFIAAVLAVGLLTALPVRAQDGELTISVSKQIGYNMGSQIQGTFKIKVRGPADLASVTFLLDGEPLGEATAAPFELSFKTDKYAPGWHEITAIGTTTGGQTLTARTLRFQFVTAEEAGEGVVKLVAPILVLVLAAAVVTGVFALLAGRKPAPVYDPSTYTPGEPRDYGLLGGTVCPKCGRPFGIHWWGLNISLVGKYDRCPHCGKWSLVRRAGREALLEAEAAEYAAHVAASPRPASDAETQLREQLDNSRFTDHI